MAKKDQSAMIRDFLKQGTAQKAFKQGRNAVNPFAGPSIPDGQYIAQIKRASFVSRGKPGKPKTFGLEILCIGICSEDGNTEVIDEEGDGEEHTVTGQSLTVFMLLKESANSTMEEAIERMCVSLQLLGFTTSKMAMSQKEMETSGGKLTYTFEDAIAEMNDLKLFVRVQLSTSNSGDFRNVNIREAISPEGLIELVGDLEEFDCILPQGEEYVEGEDEPTVEDGEEVEEGDEEEVEEEVEEGDEEEYVDEDGNPCDADGNPLEVEDEVEEGDEEEEYEVIDEEEPEPEPEPAKKRTVKKAGPKVKKTATKPKTATKAAPKKKAVKKKAVKKKAARRGR